MGRIAINFAEAFKSQRRLAAQALDEARALHETLSQLLPGEDPETGELRKDISEGLAHISEIEALIRDQWFRNR
jgi:hypothetical protein